MKNIPTLKYNVFSIFSPAPSHLLALAPQNFSGPAEYEWMQAVSNQSFEMESQPLPEKAHPSAVFHTSQQNLTLYSEIVSTPTRSPKKKTVP